MNTLNVTPIGNGVIVELQEQKETTEGGIYLPDTVEQKEDLLKTTYEGDIVLAIGPDCKQVKVGDLAYFNIQASFKPCVLNGKKYLLYREGDINVIINK
jgi:co-chaperonin GroES (HSP10)